MLRVRFHANYDDYRPVNWPVKHPYWCTGTGDDYSVVVTYADSVEYVLENWPEATNINVENAEQYIFTARFPKPDWLTLKGNK